MIDTDYLVKCSICGEMFIANHEGYWVSEYYTDESGFNFCVDHIPNVILINYIKGQLVLKNSKRFLAESYSGGQIKLLEHTKKHITSMLKYNEEELLEELRIKLLEVSVPNEISPFYNLITVSNKNILEYVMAKYTSFKSKNEILNEIQKTFTNQDELCEFIGDSGVGFLGQFKRMIENYSKKKVVKNES